MKLPETRVRKAISFRVSQYPKAYNYSACPQYYSTLKPENCFENAPEKMSVEMVFCVFPRLLDVITEGHKDHMSQLKTQNTKHKTAPQAPHPINFFVVTTAYNYRAFLTNNSGQYFRLSTYSRLSTFDSLLSTLDTSTLNSRTLALSTLDTHL